jgi:hypothetical protein
LDPRRDIRFVVELGQDEFVARGEVVEESLGEVAEELGCGRTEHGVGGGGVDVFGDGGVGGGVGGGGGLGSGVGGAELDVGCEEVG